MTRDLENILEKVEKAGFEVAVVGGAVRDLLSGKKVEDWDLATNAKPQGILKIFKNAFYHNKFGTVGVPTKSGVVEITTYRSESPYSDRRHPDEVKWGNSLEEDLKRRDFTVNAMAMRFEGGKLDDKVVDPFGGRDDLKNKLIKSVGDPDERFGEDALRLLRAVRFASTLGFLIEEKTKDALVKNSKLIAEVSGERIREEIFKIVDSGMGAEGFFMLKDVGLLTEILPELDICFSVEQKSPKRHHVFDVGTHCVLSLKNCPSGDTITKFATLLHDIGKAKVANITEEGVRTFYNHEVAGGKQVKEIADRLHLSRVQKEKLYLLVRWHQFSVSEEQTDKAIRRFIKNIGVDLIEDMMDLRIGDRLGGGLQQPESWRLKLFRQRLKEVLTKPFTVKDLKVNGRDVMEILKVKPGPKVGEILNKLFDEVAQDGKKNDRELLLKRIEEIGI